ncbi:hypothetical protein [Paenibacillus polymyxa]|uniref:hypothetical protein n=1 Tax=Paenibacillus TaxID=44249 RepID=UPI0023789F40|nr:hypothetical protein [Paenibacillus polymyxa]WDM23823.1 hypothetical protein J4I02_10205 [Paenibacillus polymyxa]
MNYRVTDTHVYVLDSHDTIHDVLCFPRSNQDYKDLVELVYDSETHEITNIDDFKVFDHSRVTAPSKGGFFYTQEFLIPILKLVNENKL